LHWVYFSSHLISGVSVLFCFPEGDGGGRAESKKKKEEKETEKDRKERDKGRGIPVGPQKDPKTQKKMRPNRSANKKTKKNREKKLARDMYRYDIEDCW